MSGIVARCDRIARSNAFDFTMLGVIVANAIVLGLETYESIDRDFGGALDTLNDVFLGIFVVELAIRLTAVGWNPRRFFSSGWNTFDFVVVAAAFVPGLRENATLLRIARLLRVVRVVRLLPDLRVLVVAVARSIPAVGSLAVLTLVILFVYGMIGWVIFHDLDPEQWGNIGEAVLTLFVLLSLESLPDQIENGRELAGDWTILYFVSFALVASFLLLNLFIGIVINSLEEARTMELRRAERELADDEPGNDADAHAVKLSDRVHALRTALDDLERELAARPPPSSAPQRRR